MGTEADLIKQNCWAEAEAAEAGKLSAQSATELSGNHRNRMYWLSENENSCYSSKSRRIHLLERNIVENSEVSRLLIESSGENSFLNERSKTLMLQIGNKYPFDP